MTTMTIRDIHSRQMRVLTYIADHPASARGEIDALVNGRNAAKSVLESLFYRGLVARSHRLGNARDWFWTATEKGLEAVERGHMAEAVR